MFFIALGYKWKNNAWFYEEICIYTLTIRFYFEENLAKKTLIELMQLLASFKTIVTTQNSPCGAGCSSSFTRTLPIHPSRGVLFAQVHVIQNRLNFTSSLYIVWNSACLRLSESVSHHLNVFFQLNDGVADLKSNFVLMNPSRLSFPHTLEHNSVTSFMILSTLWVWQRSFISELGSCSRLSVVTLSLIGGAESLHLDQLINSV